MRGLTKTGIALVLVVALALQGCSLGTYLFGETDSLNKAIGAAVAQKRLVEAVMVEIIKLQIVGRITEQEYKRAEDVYKDWYAGEVSLAKSLAAWKTVASSENGASLSLVLDQVAGLAGSFLEFAGRFVDLGAIGNRVKGSLSLGPSDYPDDYPAVASLEDLRYVAIMTVALETGVEKQF